MYTELLQTKDPVVVVDAVQRVLRTASGNKAVEGETKEEPKEVNTDIGAEFKDQF